MGNIKNISIETSDGLKAILSQLDTLRSNLKQEIPQTSIEIEVLKNFDNFIKNLESILYDFSDYCFLILED